jgi:hypothetical protein
VAVKPAAVDDLYTLLYQVRHLSSAHLYLTRVFLDLKCSFKTEEDLDDPMVKAGAGYGVSALLGGRPSASNSSAAQKSWKEKTGQ